MKVSSVGCRREWKKLIRLVIPQDFAPPEPTTGGDMDEDEELQRAIQASLRDAI